MCKKRMLDQLTLIPQRLYQLLGRYYFQFVNKRDTTSPLITFNS